MAQNAVIGSGGDYATLADWVAAEAGANYGEPTTAYINGSINAGSTCVFNTVGGNWPNGARIRAAAGQGFVGNNATTCARISHTSNLIEAANCHIDIQDIALAVTGGYNNEVFKSSNTISTTERRNITLKNLYIESAPFYHGSTYAVQIDAFSIASGLGSQYHLDIDNLIIFSRASNRGIYIAGRVDNGTFTGTVKRVTMLPTNSGSNAVNSFWIGPGNDSFLVVDKILSLAGEVRTNMIDYAYDGMSGTFTNISTRDSTGTITGVTSTSELENYAAGDYRLKATGTGNGAFPQAEPPAEQIITTNGSTEAVHTASIITSILSNQITVSSGSVFADFYVLSATTPVANQIELTSGQLNQIYTGQIVNSIVNAIDTQIVTSNGLLEGVTIGYLFNDTLNQQVINTSGVLNQTFTSIGTNSYLNEQVIDTTGILNQISDGVVINSLVNEIGDQIVTSNGSLTAFNTVTSTNQIIQLQLINSFGQSTAINDGIIFNSVINYAEINQIINSAGLLEGVGTGFIETTIQSIQRRITQGIVNTLSSGFIQNSYTNGDVQWDIPTELFDETDPIKEISLSFDQLGRPIVFYRTSLNTLRLYWYDPVIQENTITNLAIGNYPTAVFDYPSDTNQAFTDVMLFYVRDGSLYVRIQRERYLVEHDLGIYQFGMKIISAGFTVENKVQVVYEYLGSCDVITIPPINGGTGYLFGRKPDTYKDLIPYIDSGLTVDTIEDEIKFGFTLSSVDENTVSFTVAGSNVLYDLKVTLHGSAALNSTICNIWRSYREYNIVLPVVGVAGEWEFRLSHITANGEILHNGEVVYSGYIPLGQIKYRNTKAPFFFAGGKANPGVSNIYGCNAVMSNVWLEVNGERKTSTIRYVYEIMQSYTEGGGAMQIINYRKNDWIFEKT